MRNADPVGFCKNFVFSPSRPEIRVAGFKWLPKQFFENIKPGVRKKLINYLKRSEQVRVLFLERNNLLHQYVSWMVSIETQQWRAEISDSRLPLERRQIEIDPDRLRYQTREWKNNMQQFRQIFSGFPSMTLTYEELCDDTEFSMGSVQKFLNISQQKLNSSMVRLNPEPVNQRILNYEEIKMAFPDLINDEL